MLFYLILQSAGVIVESRISLEVSTNLYNQNYLQVKRDKMAHPLSVKNNKSTETENHELEIKFLLNTKQAAALRNNILKIKNISYEGRFYEKTMMFDNQEKTMDKDDARLRVRQISDPKDSKNYTIEFSYKRRIKADGGIKKEEEIETSFKTDIDSFLQILSKMGYQLVSSYERYRETYILNGVKITLDEFPFGYILEIEGDNSGIHQICKLLNLKMKKSYPLSCDDAYVDLCKKNHIKPKDHILFDDLEMPKLE